jgi:GMP synthase-like glutamine amidotransferase
MKVLVILNGNCLTDIGRILKKVDSNIIIDQMHSSKKINDVSNYDGIIILGGHQSLVNIETDENYPHPHLKSMIKNVKEWTKKEIPVLGICLGAQIIACSMGMNIKPLRYREKGYNKEIMKNDLVKNDLFFDSIKKYLRNTLSMHNDSIDDNGFSGDTLAYLLSQEKKIPYVIKNGKSYGLQMHPDLTLKMMLNHSYIFDNDVLEYFKINENSINHSSVMIFSHWINHVVKKE